LLPLLAIGQLTHVGKRATFELATISCWKPTNGNHAPVWQNHGFYEKPVKDRYAVHSLDHGVVWITYRPNLPAGLMDKPCSYSDWRYVLVSPYHAQDVLVIATSWRVQLKLNGADGPRLRQFVTQVESPSSLPLLQPLRRRRGQTGDVSRRRERAAPSGQIPVSPVSRRRPALSPPPSA
jgi:hypothetical protein